MKHYEQYVKLWKNMNVKCEYWVTEPYVFCCRYVLSNNFEEWTPEAREKVMEGVDVMLELLTSMHVSTPSIKLVSIIILSYKLLIYK